MHSVQCIARLVVAEAHSNAITPAFDTNRHLSCSHIIACILWRCQHAVTLFAQLSFLGSHTEKCLHGCLFYIRIISGSSSGLCAAYYSKDRKTTPNNITSLIHCAVYISPPTHLHISLAFCSPNAE